MKVEVKSADGQEGSARIRVKELVLVAVGDSYASGEGSPDRPAIYAPGVTTPPRNDWFLDARAPIAFPAWWDETCHRSLLSWPVLTALRLALENKDALVKLVNTTCSGAEFIDGFFYAQSKDLDANLQKGLSRLRDGVGKVIERGGADSQRYLSQAQVNAVREALCENSGYEDIAVEGQPFFASWRQCRQYKLNPDALLLSAGGNDVDFGSAVKGILVPDEGRGAAGGFAMSFLRQVAKAIPPEEMTGKIINWTPRRYRDYVSLVAVGTTIPSERTVLLRYPNPIGPAGVSCSEKNNRVKHTFMAFSPAVREAQPKLLGRRIVPVNWVVNFGKTETAHFTEHSYPRLMEMLDSAPKELSQIDWLASVRAPDGLTRYDGRLLCKDETDEPSRAEQAKLEPVYFCNPNECERKLLSEWNSELPGRRIVNTFNDAMLAQRTWRSTPTQSSLWRGAAGTFHPTAEAHAVAADSAFSGLCKVLSHQGVSCEAR